MARLTPIAQPTSRSWLGRISQTQWVVIAMVLGVTVGWLFPDSPDATGFRATDLQVLSNVFLRLIKSLVAPLLVWHARRRDRRTRRRHEACGQARAAIHHLLRDRHDDRARRRAPGREHREAGSGCESRVRRRDDGSPARDDETNVREHVGACGAAELHRCGRAKRSAADHVLQHSLRCRARRRCKAPRRRSCCRSARASPR